MYNRYVTVTHFHPTNARAVFPCWDEPSFKAQFTLKVVRDADMFALSNTNLESKRNLPDGLVEDSFEQTVKMSTYLVAMAISDYAKISNTTKNGVTVLVIMVVVCTNC